MKKTLVLASLLAAFGAASAQSTVTLSGTTAFGYQKVGAVGVGAVANKGLVETDFTVNLKGTENLGGGLTANFSVTLDNCGNVKGATASCDNSFRVGLARKDTSLALAGGFGTVTLANTRSSETAVMSFVAPTNLGDGFYDAKVFSRTGMDFLGYSMPMGALTLGASYSETANPATAGTSNGNYDADLGAKTITLSARYNAGPLSFASALKRSNYALAPTGRATNLELGATYDLGVAKIGFGYDAKPAYTSASAATLPVIDKAALAFGVSVPMGQSAFGVNFAKRGVAKIVEVGFQQNLSARTNVNASFGTRSVAATSTVADNRAQYRVSLNHAF